MSHVYVLNNGSIVGIEGGKLLITKDKEVVRTIPKETVESISVFGNSSLTTPCMKYCMEQDISVSFFSERGKYYGRLESTSNDKVEVLKQQFKMFDDDSFAIAMGRKLISAKVHNQIVLLKRYVDNNDNDFSPQIEMMKRYEQKVANADSIEQIMGFEGIAARNYFDLLAKVIRPDFAFHGRTRRPPTDRFNSMISLGYSILTQEIHGQLHSVGLTPYYSILMYAHQPAGFASR